MEQCQGKTKTGNPCKARPGSDGFCFRHRPGSEAEEARLEASSKGGRGGRWAPVLDETEVSDISFDGAQSITTFCACVAKWTLSGRIESKTANAVILAASTALRSLDAGEVEAQMATLREEIENITGRTAA